MSITELSRPLGIDEVDFRIQSINNGGYATILVYKDARVDQNRLDQAVGRLNWQREHLNNNANCRVSIWCDQKQQWVSKEDTGTQSSAEKEKGLASDSFKRACFNWGIGRELYEYPRISIKLEENKEYKMTNGKPKQVWGFNLNDWNWSTLFDDGKLVYISARDLSGKQRFLWDDYDYLVKANKSSISCIKNSIESGEYSLGLEAWDELEEGLKMALWKAHTKGGCFTSEEQKVMKSTEFRKGQNINVKMEG
jgi:hypothetical protein